ncbi:MAG: class I SAM-dependent methyltransferase [Ignavibacteria bacterium]|nr:class I SAM-dependent methyltransferase [Ignavibacteria bacterium]
MGRLNLNKDFYNSISAEYDSMVNSDSIIKARKNILKKFLDENCKYAADIGCGTGNDSIALSLNGINVTGFEPSEDMLKSAERKAVTYEQKIKFVNTSAGKIGKEYYGKFDLAISLGNTIANIKPSELKTAFKKAYMILKDEGKFLVQVLNYDNIRKENKRIVNVTGSGDKLFLRFYDFYTDRLNFNILTINKNNHQEYNLITTRLYEYKKNELAGLLKTSGFKKISFYADFNLNPFNPKTSKDLILIARK